MLGRMSRLDLLDWRRRVTVLYAQVRAHADPATAHDLWVRTRTELLLQHPQSPIPAAQRTDVRIRHAGYDREFRFVVDVEPADQLRLEVETGTDGVVRQERIGRIRLPDLGSLDVWWIAGYGGGVFLPLADGDPETYGGGRYVLDTIKGADLGSDPDGRLVVDLNFAYNPSCVYDPSWACPLAPAGNRVVSAIPVGELTPRR
jgi:uncharacterized protein (DUF1684 family)